MPLADVPLDAASPDAGLLPLPPHAAIAVLTSAAAPPVSAARRLIAASGCRSGASSLGSCHSRRSSASLTGSSSDIVPPPQWGVGNACAGVRHDTVPLSSGLPLLSLTSEAVKAYCER